MKCAWLFAWAIVLHNTPEGLAIGVAFGGTDNVGATALATGISIQDVPERLVVAAALRGVGYSRITAVDIGAASSLVEPLAAILGALVIGISGMLLPWDWHSQPVRCSASSAMKSFSSRIVPDMRC